jgi:hypothetical protein
MARSARWAPLALTAIVAGMLTGAAAVTVEQAGCDEPGMWVVSSHRAELVGGCLDREELPVAPQPAPAPAQSTPFAD